MSEKIPDINEFEDFTLDTGKKILWHGGEIVPLPPKAVAMLVVLFENAGDVVTKEDLLDKVWGDEFVEEANLTNNIYLLRKTFGEFGADTKDLIQTVPRKGYRFVPKTTENGSEIILERHVFEQTLVENVSETLLPSERANTKLLEKADIVSRRGIFIISAVAIVLLLGVFSFWRFSSGSARIKSIAILPLKSLNETEDDKALSFGFADALITSLGNAGDIRIISASAVSRYADLAKEPFEIGKDLGVESVLEGTLQRSDGRLRITLRLIRTSDGAQIWSGLFNESESEIFRLQDSIAAQTSQALALNFKPKEDAKRPTENLEAYDLFLKGEYIFTRRELQTRAAPFFRQAIRLDPNFAKAWAGLAGDLAMKKGSEVEEAETAVEKALELDPNLAEAHAVYGFIRMFHYRDWQQAEKSLNRAIELDPSSVEAHHWRGCLLSFHGRLDEAKTEMKRALELDPLNLNITIDIAQLYYFSHDYEQAEEICKKALAVDPNYAHVSGRLRFIYEQQGRQEETFGHFLISHTESLSGLDRAERIKELKDAHERGGMPQIYKMLIEETLNARRKDWIAPDEYPTSYFSLANSYLRLGDKEKAIEYLNRALESKPKFDRINYNLPYMKVDPNYDSLRDDPRFQEILRKINL